MPPRPRVGPVDDSLEVELELESREGVDVESVPPLPQELVGQLPGHGAEAEAKGSCAAEQQESRTQSPSKQTTLDDSRLDDSGSWRLKGAWGAEDSDFAYLSTDPNDFSSDDGEAGGGLVESGEAANGPRRSQNWQLHLGSSLREEDSLASVEYEDRSGILVADDPSPSDHGELNRAPVAAKYAVYRRTTSSARQLLPAQSGLGLDVVCDPMLTPASSPSPQQGKRCRRGAKVVLIEAYARKQGLRNCLGAVGMLESRVKIGIWTVLFPSVGSVCVSVGDDSCFGLLYADSVPGLAGAAASSLCGADYANGEGSIAGHGAALPRQCARGCAPAGRKRNNEFFMSVLDSSPSQGGVQGRQPRQVPRQQVPGRHLGAATKHDPIAAHGRNGARGLPSNDDIVLDNHRQQITHDIAPTRQDQVLDDAMGEGGAGSQLFARERLLSRFFSIVDTGKLGAVPDLALKFQGKDESLRARLSAKYGVDHHSDPDTLRECQRQRDRQLLARRLAGSHGAGDDGALGRRQTVSETVCHVSAEDQGQFFEWGDKGILLELIFAEDMIRPLMLVRADNKDLVCAANHDDFRLVLKESRVVAGVVEDGRQWVNAGTAYKCVKGAHVMIRVGYAAANEGWLKAYLHNRDGSRLVGMLHRRVRIGEWEVVFPGPGPVVRLPVGVHGQYALQYVDKGRWLARAHKYVDAARGASSRHTYLRCHRHVDRALSAGSKSARSQGVRAAAE